MTSTTWRDLREGGIGSFRNVEFRCLSISISSGRRTSVHDLYRSDNYVIEDVGIHQRVFSVEGIVLGDNYYDSRDAIISAFDSGDREAVLSYPIIGAVTVELLGKYTIRESSQDMGSAYFSAEFIEIPSTLSIPSPSIIADAASADQVIDDTASAIEDAAGDIGDRGTVLQALQSSINFLVGKINDAATAVRSIRSRVQSAIGTIESVSDGIENLAGAAAALISTPSDLFRAVDASINSIFSAISSIESATSKTIAALTGGGPALIGRSVSRFKINLMSRIVSNGKLYLDINKAEQNRDVFGVTPSQTTDTSITSQAQAYIDTVKISIAYNAMLFIAQDPTLSFESSDQATVYRDIVISLLDDVLDRLGDEAFSSAYQARASFISYISSIIRSLPSEEFYTTTSVVSSLYLSNLIYGTVLEEDKISLSNNIENPAVIPAGTRIKVIR